MPPKIKLEQTDNLASAPEEIKSENTSMTDDNNAAVPKPKRFWIVLVLVVIVLAAAGFVAKDKFNPVFKWGGRGEVLSGYQAVFLSNGQVYFGKLSDVSDTYVTLKDIYYLQVVQQQQQLQGQQATQSGQQPQVSLVKLGNELHGPADVMKINRNQILFYEDLKTDSQVVRAIKDYVQKPKEPAPQAVQPTPTPEPVQPQPVTTTSPAN